MSTVPSNSASSGVGHSATPWSPEYLSRYDTIVFDCDGVLWHETTPIAGAIRTLERLQELGKRLLFATNNSGKSRETYGEKFTQLGFAPQPVKIEPKQIFTSSMATAAWLKKQPKEVFDVAKQKCFVIGESGIAAELRAVGIECIEAQQMFGTRHLSKSELAKIEIDPAIGCVVVGIDEQFTYTKAAYAVACLTSLKDNSTDGYRSIFVSTNQDSNLPTGGHSLPGAGSVVSMIATASSRTPINIGKPESHIMDLAIAECQLDPSRVLMVGDRLDTDILFGEKCKVDTLFVTETGINKRQDMDKLNIYPHYFADNVACMVGKE